MRASNSVVRHTVEFWDHTGSLDRRGAKLGGGPEAYIESLDDKLFVQLLVKLLPRDQQDEAPGQLPILKIVSFATDADGRPLLGGVPVD